MTLKRNIQKTGFPHLLILFVLFLSVLFAFNAVWVPHAFGVEKIVKNGFDLSNSILPPEQILSGGPPKDGIPSIDNPQFVQSNRATFLTDQSRVLGLHLNGFAKAYPIAILNWHEVVNDFFGEKKVAITYCPLCGTGVAFATGTKKSGNSFGVSGLLYNSDVLLYDRETNSLWSQIKREAVAGPKKGEKLSLLPLTHTTWKNWKQQFPRTTVLSTKTGYNRNYTRNPYANYNTSKKIWFPVSNQDNRFHPKEFVLGLELKGKFKAYPFSELQRVPQKTEDTFAGTVVTIHFDKEERAGFITDAQGSVLPVIQAYWFAWAAFHPKTEIFTYGKDSTAQKN